MTFLSIQSAPAASLSLSTMATRLRAVLVMKMTQTRKTPEQIIAAQARRAAARAATDRLLR